MPTRPATETRTLCPSCAKKGKRVGPVTLRALLKDEYRNAVPCEGNGGCESEASGCKAVTEDTGWRFCDSQGCDVVYFAEPEGAVFSKDQLRVPVGVKETTGDRPLCYCFGHSVATIKEELRTKGRSDAREDIRRKMKNPGCSCEVTNPSGSCCLGSVAKGIEIAQQELGSAESHNQPPSSKSAGEKIAKIGALASAIVASSCCWLPLVLLAVGISGVGIAATLEAYRPIFIVVTFGFLAAAFYFTYRPRQAGKRAPQSAASTEHACCVPEPTEGCCAPSGKRRLSIMTMNKLILWLVTLLAVAFLFFPSYVGLLLGTGGGARVAVSMNRTLFKVEGMTCEACAATVAKAIRTIPGVLGVQVDYQKGQAIVGTDACCPVPRDGILAALQRADTPAHSSSWRLTSVFRPAEV